MYLHAYRKRRDLALTPAEVLETRPLRHRQRRHRRHRRAVLPIATIGGPPATAIAGPIYFLIGPFKWALGTYSRKGHQRLAAPADQTDQAG